MDINKAFTYVFEDKQWLTKLGIGSVVALVPILNFAWIGYLIGIMRNVMDGQIEPLPDWSDLGKKFMDGLFMALAGLVYALPILLVACLPLSIMLIPAMLDSSGDIAQAAAGAGSVLMICLTCLLSIYGLVLSVIYPAIQINFARVGTFSALFDFKKIFGMVSQYAGPFFTAWLVSIGAGLLIGLVSGFLNAFLSIIPCIGWIAALLVALATVAFVTAINGHLFGQFGALALGSQQTGTGE